MKMNLMQEFIYRAVKATNTTGWQSVKCWCNHNHQKTAAVLFINGGVIYTCRKCGFKTGWAYPNKFSQKFRIFLKNFIKTKDQEQEFNKLVLQQIIGQTLKEGTMEFEEMHSTTEIVPFDMETVPTARSMIEWLEAGYDGNDLIACIDYLESRGLSLDDYEWYWNCEKPNYVMIPYKHNGQIVGYTSRSIDNRGPKYLSSKGSQIGYLFNLDKQKDSGRDVMYVVEGIIDAIMINGVATQGNDLSQYKINLINQTAAENHQTVVLVPDQDAAGTKLIEIALANKWRVSLPKWGSKVKDYADAVKEHGRSTALNLVNDGIAKNDIHIELEIRKITNRF